MAQRVVAVLATRYADLAIEQEVLGPPGIELVGADADVIVAAAARVASR